MFHGPARAALSRGRAATSCYLVRIGGRIGKLAPLKVKNAKPKIGPDGKLQAVRLTYGEGLQVLVQPSGRKSWVLRVMVDGKRREIGLGAVDVKRLGGDAFGDHSPLDEIPLMLRNSLTLLEAREKAAALRKLAKAGADPVLERDRERTTTPTFAREYLIKRHGITVACETLRRFMIQEVCGLNSLPPIG